MSDATTGKWCYSTTNEAYRGTFATEGEAQSAAIDAIEADSDDIGTEREYWLAQAVHPVDKITSRWMAGSLLEQVTEWADEEIGAEESCMDFTKQDEADFASLVKDFIRERAGVNWYGITEPVKRIHVVGDTE